MSPERYDMGTVYVVSSGHNESTICEHDIQNPKGEVNSKGTSRS